MEDMTQARITVLATGGTIASAGAGGAATTVYTVTTGVDQLLDAVPDAATLADVSGEQVTNVPSHELTSRDVLGLARRIARLQTEGACDGIVVTHGTDTIEETAFLLTASCRAGFRRLDRRDATGVRDQR